MFFFFVLVKNLNLLEMKWLISHSENKNLYIVNSTDQYITVIQASYPDNYEDGRVVEFRSLDPMAHSNYQDKGKERDDYINSSYQIILGNKKVCGTYGKYASEIVECQDLPNDQDSWRIKSVEGGFRIYNKDKCITLVKSSDGSLDTQYHIELLSCAKNSKSVWKIEMMERNFIYPKDLDEKYTLLPKQFIPLNQPLKNRRP